MADIRPIPLTGLYDEYGEIVGGYLELAPTDDAETNYLEVPCGTCDSIHISAPQVDGFTYASRSKVCKLIDNGLDDYYIIEESQFNTSNGNSYEIEYGHSPTNFLRIHINRVTEQRGSTDIITGCTRSVLNEYEGQVESMYYDVTTPSGCGFDVAGTISVEIPPPELLFAPIFTTPDCDCPIPPLSCLCPSQRVGSTWNTYSARTYDIIVDICVTPADAGEEGYYPDDWGPPQ